MVSDKREFSPGWGDGVEAVIAKDISRVEVNYNAVHPHLPGDFLRRKVDGDHVLMTWEKFEALQYALHWLKEYWVDCRAFQEALDDYQISEISNRIALLSKMLGEPK